MRRLRSPISILLASTAVLVVALFAGCGNSNNDSGSSTTASLSDCTPDKLDTHKAGTLTVATDKPAYPPYFEDDDPSNGKGFESAVAYAIADQLGFKRSDVEWTVEPFNSSYAPGPKDFDFDVNQISITPARSKQVDFSSPYYEAKQAVVAAQGLRRGQGDLARRPEERRLRRPDRDHQPRCGQHRDPAR